MEKSKALLRKRSFLLSQGALPSTARNGSLKNYGAIGSSSQTTLTLEDGAIRQQEKINMLMKIQDVSTMK